MQIIHQPAFLDRQNLIEGPRDMKADGRYVFQTLTLIIGQGRYLLFCQVAFIRTTKVELIAVGLCLYTAEYRTKLRQLNLSNTSQLVVHLFLLVLQLFLVWQVLPFTSTADTEMLTERSCAYITIFYKANHFCLHETVLLATHLQVNHVTWNRPGYEHHHIVDPGKALTFCGHVCDGYIF